jgi:hypothetical protein
MVVVDGRGTKIAEKKNVTNASDNGIYLGNLLIHARGLRSSRDLRVAAGKKSEKRLSRLQVMLQTIVSSTVPYGPAVAIRSVCHPGPSQVTSRLDSVC